LRSENPLTLGKAFVANFILFYIWAALTPLIIWLGWRFPVERPNWARNFSVLFFISFPIALLHLLLLVCLNQLIFDFSEPFELLPDLRKMMVGMGASNVMLFWSVVVAGQAFTYFRRYKEREFSLMQARLLVLKTQLQPHFLFNTLNAISELVHEDADRAENTISQLGDLLRLSLNTQMAHEVTLGEELNFLRKYIEIQQTLLQKRLKIQWNVAPATLNAHVPNMILQPLIENAIQHGIAPRASGGTVEIKIYRSKEQLVLSVKDNGVGLEPNAQPFSQNGIGLRNVKARLQHLYGNSHRLNLTLPAEGCGLCIELKIPFNENGFNRD
jgi:signal transduction histidine kinase